MRRHQPGEIPDRGRTPVFRHFVPVHRNTRVHRCHPARIQPQAAAHDIPVRIAHGDEKIAIRQSLPDRGPATLHVLRLDMIDPRILVLQGAHDRDVQHFLDPAGKPQEKDGADVHHVWPAPCTEPGHEPFQFLCLVSLAAAKHRQCHLPETRRPRGTRLPGRQPQQPTGVKRAIQPARGLPEQRALLLQVRVDGSEKDRALPLQFRRVRVERQVQGDKGQLLPLSPQRLHQHRVAQAVFAVEPSPRSRQQLHDLHGEVPASLSDRARDSAPVGHSRMHCPAVRVRPLPIPSPNGTPTFES